MVGRVSGPLWILFGSVAVVLLIACANVGNLFLVRAERRQRELAVRRAIGAARFQLFRAQLTEAAVVAVLAGALAMVLAWVSVPLYLRFVPPDVPRIGDVHVRWEHAALHRRRVGAGGALLRRAPGPPRVRAEPRSAARREPRVHRAPALGPRRPRRGADGARARPPHRIGAAVPELPGDAERRPGLRHARHLHLPDRARGRSAEGRRLVRPVPSRLHGAAGPSAGRDLGGHRGPRPAQRGPRRRPVPPVRARGRDRRRRPARLHAPSRATTSRPWGSGCSRAGRSPRPTSSPTWGTSSSTSPRPICSGRGSRPSGGGSSGRRSPSGRRSSAWWKT